MAVEYKKLICSVSDEEYPRNRKAEEEALNELIHLRPCPHEASLKTVDLLILRKSRVERRDYNVAQVYPLHKPVDGIIGSVGSNLVSSSYYFEFWIDVQHFVDLNFFRPNFCISGNCVVCHLLSFAPFALLPESTRAAQHRPDPW